MSEPSAREFEALSQAMRDLTLTVNALRLEFANVYARKDVIEPRMTAIEADVAKHASYWDWVVRLVIGAVIVALLGLVITQGAHNL